MSFSTWVTIRRSFRNYWNGFSPVTQIPSREPDTSDGANIALNKSVNIEAGTFVTLPRFKVIGGSSLIFPITLDNINFDSDSLVFFEIVSGVGSWGRRNRPADDRRYETYEFRYRRCEGLQERQRITVYNTGVIPVRFDSLSLPKWHTVTASSIPLPAMLSPGDSVQLTVTFCPRDSSVARQ